jgi:hypothetical protein
MHPSVPHQHICRDLIGPLVVKVLRSRTTYVHEEGAPKTCRSQGEHHGGDVHQSYESLRLDLDRCMAGLAVLQKLVPRISEELHVTD